MKIGKKIITITYPDIVKPIPVEIPKKTPVKTPVKIPVEIPVKHD